MLFVCRFVVLRVRVRVYYGSARLASCSLVSSNIFLKVPNPQLTVITTRSTLTKQYRIIFNMPMYAHL